MSRPLQPVPPQDERTAVPFSTRISVQSRRTIERVVQNQGLSVRQVIELAIADRWEAESASQHQRAVGE